MRRTSLGDNVSFAEVTVSLPAHLRRLAEGRKIRVVVGINSECGEITLEAVLDALERAYPMLRGTIRNFPSPEAAAELRPFIRVFACERDLTPSGLVAPLPHDVIAGKEVLRIVGAIAGGSPTWLTLATIQISG